MSMSSVWMNYEVDIHAQAWCRASALFRCYLSTRSEGPGARNDNHPALGSSR